MSLKDRQQETARIADLERAALPFRVVRIRLERDASVSGPRGDPIDVTWRRRGARATGRPAMCFLSKRLSSAATSSAWPRSGGRFLQAAGSLWTSSLSPRQADPVRLSRLSNAPVVPYIPASDITRARKFYEEKVGLKPKQEYAGGVIYECGKGSWVFMYPSPAPAHHEPARHSGRWRMLRPKSLR